LSGASSKLAQAGGWSGAPRSWLIASSPGPKRRLQHGADSQHRQLDRLLRQLARLGQAVDNGSDKPN
jgi:hypothetical protein